MCDPASLFINCITAPPVATWCQEARETAKLEREADKRLGYHKNHKNHKQRQLEESRWQIQAGQQYLQVVPQLVPQQNDDLAQKKTQLADVLCRTEVVRQKLEALLKEQAEASAHRAGPSAQEAPAMQTMSPQALARNVEASQKQEALQNELNDLQQQCIDYQHVQAQCNAQIDQLTGSELSIDPNKQPRVLAPAWRVAIQEIKRLRALVPSRSTVLATAGPSTPTARRTIRGPSDDL